MERFLPAGVLALVLAGLCWCGVRTFRAGYAWELSREAAAQDAGVRAGLLARALKLDPGNPTITRDLGVAYLWLGYEYHSAEIIYAMKARDVADRGLAGTPDLAGLLEIRAAAMARLHRVKEAQADLRRAKALQPWKR